MLPFPTESCRPTPLAKPLPQHSHGRQKGKRETKMAEKTPSSFSRSLASALKGYLRERGIQQKTLAARLDRSTGYVSEHLNGLSAVDTDMIDAVAELAGVSSRHLYEVLGRRVAEADGAAARDPVEAAADRIAASARERVQQDKGSQTSSDQADTPRQKQSPGKSA